MSERTDTRITFTSRVNGFTVRSYGGGAPRWASIKYEDREELSITMSEAHDLRYVLDRMLKECGYDPA